MRRRLVTPAGWGLVAVAVLFVALGVVSPHASRTVMVVLSFALFVFSLGVIHAMFREWHAEAVEAGNLARQEWIEARARAYRAEGATVDEAFTLAELDDELEPM